MKGYPRELLDDLCVYQGKDQVQYPWALQTDILPDVFVPIDQLEQNAH